MAIRIDSLEETVIRVAHHPQVQQLKLSLDLALGRRWILVLIANAALLASLFFQMALGGLKAESGYDSWVFLLIILGVPTTSDIVAVERKWGSMDMTLAAPGSDTYFYRRTGLVIGALTVEAIALVLLLRFAVEAFPLWPVLLQGIVVSTLVGTATLFWAVRLRTSGSALVATYLTILVLWKWLSANPVFGPTTRIGILYPDFLWEFAKRLPVLAMAAILFFAYTRRILRNPESILL